MPQIALLLFLLRCKSWASRLPAEKRMLNAMEDQVKHFLLVVVTLTALAAGLSYYSFWQGTREHERQRQRQEQLQRSQERQQQQQLAERHREQLPAQREWLRRRLSAFSFRNLDQGTELYHRTSYDFDPRHNTSHFYTRTPPASEATFRDFRLIQYETTRNLQVISSPNPTGIEPLKQAVYTSMTGSSGNVSTDREHRDRLCQLLWQAGIEGVGGSVDNTGAHIEVLVSFDDGNIATSPLQFIRERKL